MSWRKLRGQRTTVNEFIKVVDFCECGTAFEVAEVKCSSELVWLCNDECGEVVLKCVFANMVQWNDERLTLVFYDSRSSKSFYADDLCWSSPSVFVLSVWLSPYVANGAW